MISVYKAKKLLIKNVNYLASEKIPLRKSINRIIAEDIFATISHPSFDQSAVDGYGIRYKDSDSAIQKKIYVEIIGEIKAGDYPKMTLKPMQAVRIYTGSAVPEGCDTIIMQEDVKRYKNQIEIKRKIKKGDNIRKQGKQIKKGELALKKGTKLNSAAIGFLSSIGVVSVRVSELPSIGVVVTGNEFQANGKLRIGMIYESNGKILQSLFKSIGIKVDYKLCDDNKARLLKTIGKMVERNNFTIITGGVSVGDYDFTKEIILKLGYKIIFHNVSQKPGKPLLFAKKRNNVVFGLPGNPRSVLVCFYEYIYPFIFTSMKAKDPFLTKIKLLLNQDFDKKNERAYFLSGEIDGNNINFTNDQESHMLKSFAESNAIIFMPEGKKKYNSGELVEVHLLNQI